jgi:hypothetical protein
MGMPVVAVVRSVRLDGAFQLPDLAFKDPTHFGFRAEVFIGDMADDEAVADLFDVLVCSPSWFADQVAHGELIGPGSRYEPTPLTVRAGSGTLFMKHWSQSDFEAALATICKEASPGPDWDTVAARLGRVLSWESEMEFDDSINKAAGLPAIHFRDDSV